MGIATVVRSDDPSSWYEIDVYPVCDAIVARSRELILFADFTNVADYGRDSLAGKSERLAADEVGFVRVKGDAVRCKGYFPWLSTDLDGEFWVSLDTGTPVGEPVLVERKRH